jgi:hypothetical protein
MVSQFRRNLPGVDAFVEEQVSIPVGWWVTEQDRAYIAVTVHKVCEELAEESQTQA